MAARKGKATARKTAKKAPAKKTTARKTTAKKSPARKTVAKKTTARKTAAKKTTARKTTAKKAPAKAASRASKSVKVGKKPFTKSDLIRTICDQTELQRKDVVAVMESFSEIIAGHLAKNGPEAFAWPGLLKMKVVKKPATKARKGINPFTGEEMMFKAKPASRKVKITALKQLKEMVS